MEKHLSFHCLKVYFGNGDHVDVWLLYNIYPFVLRPRQNFMNAIYCTKNCYLLLIILIVTHILTMGKRLVIWYQLDNIHLFFATDQETFHKCYLLNKKLLSSLNEVDVNKIQHVILLAVFYVVAIYVYIFVYWHGRVVLSVKGSSATSIELFFSNKNFQLARI